MSTISGKDGSVAVGAVAIAEVRDWSVETTAAMVNDTVMGDVWTTSKATQKSWSATVNCYLDAADLTGQGVLVEGAEVTLNLYPSGNTSTNQEYTGTVIVGTVSRSGAHDGMVEISFSATGTGALTIGVIA